MKTSKIERTNYVLLWDETDAIEVNFTAFVTKLPGGEFKLGYVSWKFSDSEKLLRLAWLGLEHEKLDQLSSEITELLKTDLNQNLYSLYHVGQLVD